jgi:hypothetical protein
MSRDEIVPTYRIPPLVRAVSGSVDQSGFEPPASPVPRAVTPMLPGSPNGRLLSPMPEVTSRVVIASLSSLTVDR